MSPNPNLICNAIEEGPFAFHKHILPSSWLFHVVSDDLHFIAVISAQVLVSICWWTFKLFSNIQKLFVLVVIWTEGRQSSFSRRIPTICMKSTWTQWAIDSTPELPSEQNSPSSVHHINSKNKFILVLCVDIGLKPTKITFLSLHSVDYVLKINAN